MNTSRRIGQLAWTSSLGLGVVMLTTAWVQARVALPPPSSPAGLMRAYEGLAFDALPAPQSADICGRLVDAIVEVESSGHARRVGTKGERGLMQMKAGTWSEVTSRLYGQRVSFDRAFEPALNRRVGLAYLRQLRAFLAEHRGQWRADERTLLLACYNAGPGRVREAGFCFEQLPATTRDYVIRAMALHDCLRREDVAQAPSLQPGA